MGIFCKFLVCSFCANPSSQRLSPVDSLCLYIPCLSFISSTQQVNQPKWISSPYAISWNLLQGSSWMQSCLPPLRNIVITCLIFIALHIIFSFIMSGFCCVRLNIKCGSGCLYLNGQINVTLLLNEKLPNSYSCVK